MQWLLILIQILWLKTSYKRNYSENTEMNHVGNKFQDQSHNLTLIMCISQSVANENVNF